LWAAVAAHNHVLRRWLRGESADPLTELDVALRQATMFLGGPAPGNGATIAVFRTDEDIDTLLPVLRRLARDAHEA
jgi:hypothetical protein